MKKDDVQKKETPNISGDKSDSSVKADLYFYEPDTCVILGLIHKETFYGPPGYGENPKKDSKEDCFVLTLYKPIKVKPKEGSDKDFDIEQKNIDKIQVYSNNDKVNKYLEINLGSRVMLKGKLFGAQTGHHHTPVLLEVLEYIRYENKS